jgi:hypothetical protein
MTEHFRLRFLSRLSAIADVDVLNKPRQRLFRHGRRGLGVDHREPVEPATKAIGARLRAGPGLSILGFEYRG